MNAFDTIKRTAKFTLEDELVDQRSYYTWHDIGAQTWQDLGAENYNSLYTLTKASALKIDYLSDRVQPFILYQMPDGGWIEFSLGIFLLSSPKRTDQYGQTVRKIDAYDGLIILDEDKFTDRTYFSAGTLYSEVIRDIITSAGIEKINIEINSGARLPSDKEFALGDSKLSAVNSLLSEINNTPLWVDASGYYRSKKYQRPDDRAIGYTYSDQDMSIIIQGIEEDLDLSEVANSWVATVSNPDTPVMTSRKDNTNIDSPTSIPSRNRRIVDFRKLDNMANQIALDAYVEQIALEASQVYGKIKFSTATMPFHEYYDVIQFEYSPLEINDRYAESSWSIKLEAGAEMTHEVRKVVSID